MEEAVAGNGTQTVVYSIVSISIIALSFRFVVPFFKENLPHFWDHYWGLFLLSFAFAFPTCYHGEEKPFGGIYDPVA